MIFLFLGPPVVRAPLLDLDLEAIGEVTSGAHAGEDDPILGPPQVLGLDPGPGNLGFKESRDDNKNRGQYFEEAFSVPFLPSRLHLLLLHLKKR